MRYQLRTAALIRAAALTGALITLAGCIVAPYPPPPPRYVYRPYHPYYYPY